MIGLFLAMVLARSSFGECLPPWTELWYVRLTYEARPGMWSVTGTRWGLDRRVAVAERERILRHGWRWPPLTPGPSDPELRGEVRVAPGALRYVSVKRACCRMDLPPQERPDCTWPDGDPPPGP